LHIEETNLDPKLHPLEAAREYKRALNAGTSGMAAYFGLAVCSHVRAVKLERVMAKPFVKALSGHTDGVTTFAKHPHKLSTLLSGAADGEVRLWSLTSSACIFSATLHKCASSLACQTADERDGK
jgi:DDB1- and CUL4-associated factor 13